MKKSLKYYRWRGHSSIIKGKFSFSFSFKDTPYDRCLYANGIGTTEHYLLNCPFYQTQRETLLSTSILLSMDSYTTGRNTHLTSGWFLHLGPHLTWGNDNIGYDVGELILIPITYHLISFFCLDHHTFINQTGNFCKKPTNRKRWNHMIGSMY